MKLQNVPISVTLQRKKSLPDVQQLPINKLMSREEVSVLGSARREEVRRLADESERYKANPLLYLVSPQVKVNRKFNFFFRLDLTTALFFTLRVYNSQNKNNIFFEIEFLKINLHGFLHSQKNLLQTLLFVIISHLT